MCLHKFVVCLLLYSCLLYTSTALSLSGIFIIKFMTLILLIVRFLIIVPFTANIYMCVYVHMSFINIPIYYFDTRQSFYIYIQMRCEGNTIFGNTIRHRHNNQNACSCFALSLVWLNHIFCVFMRHLWHNKLPKTNQQMNPLSIEIQCERL